MKYPPSPFSLPNKLFTAIVIVMLIMTLASLGTLVAFSWAANNRQFEDLDGAAETIFDPDEPIGQPTDPAIPNANERR